MNEYADLFSKKPNPPTPQTPRSQVFAIAEYEQAVKNRRINSLSLLLYFGLTLLFIGISVFYRDSLYSDQPQLLDQITVVNEPSFQLTESEDPNFEHRMTFQSTFRNNSSELLRRFSSKSPSSTKRTTYSLSPLGRSSSLPATKNGSSTNRYSSTEPRFDMKSKEF
ncbi:MAG: hypothetical protein MZU97_04195 [Bacillus subtilis]|nr:hypothetical protein [Bacillus subtilis]